MPNFHHKTAVTMAKCILEYFNFVMACTLYTIVFFLYGLRYTLVYNSQRFRYVRSNQNLFFFYTKEIRVCLEKVAIDFWNGKMGNTTSTCRFLLTCFRYVDFVNDILSFCHFDGLIKIFFDANVKRRKKNGSSILFLRAYCWWMPSYF